MKLFEYSGAVVRERKVVLRRYHENKITVREVWIYSFVTVCVGRHCFRQWYVFWEHSDYAIVVILLRRD